MYSEMDFHGLSEEEQRRLINRKQVATSSRLLEEVPSDGTAVRVFEKPLEEFVLDRLESGRFTISDLADEFSVSDTDVRVLINKYRRRGRDGFTSESFKYNLLTDRNGVVRVKGSEGREFQYSLETVPYIARIVDPTLTISLPGIEEQLEEFPTIVENVPGGRATEIDETYALLLGDFWEIDPQVIFDEITDYDRKYVETAVMPFPLIDSSGVGYQQVYDRLTQPDFVYKRYRQLEQTTNEVVNEFLNVIERGQPGIRMYQVVSIDLADLRRAAQIESPTLVSTIDERINEIASTLDPDSEPDRFEESSDTLSVDIEDEVQSVLGKSWITAEEVYEALPSVVQAETNLQETQQVLDQLSGLGVISKRNDEHPSEYNSESGTVSTRDVL